MLYVYTIQQQDVPNIQFHHDYLSAAVQCQTQLSTIAEIGSLTERYCLVLEELRKEAVKGSKHPKTDVFAEASTKYPSRKGELTQPNEHAVDNSATMQPDVNTGDMTDITSFEITPGNLVYEMSGWGAFDSMVSYLVTIKGVAVGELTWFKVTSGFGNIEDLLGNESFF